jgi:predicted transcriptional regulator
MDKMRGTKGMIPSKIIQKAGVNPDALGSYLKFLEGEGLVGSRMPERNEAYSNSEKIFYLTYDGVEFMKGWDRYKNKSNLDALRKQLEKV